jgi:hypothetical protein
MSTPRTDEANHTCVTDLEFVEFARKLEGELMVAIVRKNNAEFMANHWMQMAASYQNENEKLREILARLTTK